MNRICLFLYTLMLFVGASLQCDFVMGQTVSFQPNVDGHYLDFHVKDNDQTILLTTQGSYILNQKEALLITALDSLQLHTRKQSGCDEPLLFPLDKGKMAHLKKDGSLDVLEDVDRGMYLKYSNGDSWKISDQIYFKTDEDHQLAYKFFSQYNPDENIYTDALVYHQTLWLATENFGIVSIEKPLGQSEFRFKEYREGSGLISNRCTSLSKYGNTGLLVGHYGSISSIGQFQLDFSEHTQLAVDQIVVDGETIYCLTRDAIIKITPELKITKIDLPVSDYEQLLKMTIRKDKSLMVLTEESIHIIPHQTYVQHEIINEQPNTPIKYYQVRNTHYYTDGVTVYGYNPKNNQWEQHKGKEAPQHVVVEDNRVRLLFGNGRGTTIAKDSAQVLRRIASEKSALLDVSYTNGQEYHLTYDGFYRKDKIGYTTINEDKEPFHKHISDVGDYVFSQNGVYTLVNRRLEMLLKAKRKEGYPFSQNQFASYGRIVTFNSAEVIVIDMTDNSVNNLNMAPLIILDIIEKEDDIWLLTPKSLVALDKRRALSGEKVISKVLPLNQQIDQAKLYNGNTEQQLLVAGTDKLLTVDLDGAIKSFMSQMELVYATTSNGQPVVKKDELLQVYKKDLPLTLSFSPTNYNTKRAKYSYHLNYEGKNTSEWSNKGDYTFEPPNSGHYTLVAKYVDDVYGVKHTTNPIQIHVVEETVVAASETVSAWHIPLILISLLLLWFGWWLKGKLTV